MGCWLSLVLAPRTGLIWLVGRRCPVLAKLLSRSGVVGFFFGTAAFQTLGRVTSLFNRIQQSSPRAAAAFTSPWCCRNYYGSVRQLQVELANFKLLAQHYASLRFDRISRATVPIGLLFLWQFWTRHRNVPTCLSPFREQQCNAL